MDPIDTESVPREVYVFPRRDGEFPRVPGQTWHHPSGLSGALQTQTLLRILVLSRFIHVDLPPLASVSQLYNEGWEQPLGCWAEGMKSHGRDRRAVNSTCALSSLFPGGWGGLGGA